MPTKKIPVGRNLQAPILALATLAIVSSFAIGIQTSGNVETIAPSQANDMLITGDINADQMVDIQDVIEILEIAQGYEEATPQQLRADPNNDGSLTVDDAVRLLHDIASRS